jgi:hypothetical protein
MKYILVFNTNIYTHFIINLIDLYTTLLNSKCVDKRVLNNHQPFNS